MHNCQFAKHPGLKNLLTDSCEFALIYHEHCSNAAPSSDFVVFEEGEVAHAATNAVTPAGGGGCVATFGAPTSERLGLLGRGPAADAAAGCAVVAMVKATLLFVCAAGAATASGGVGFLLPGGGIELLLPGRGIARDLSALTASRRGTGFENMMASATDDELRYAG